MMRDLMAVFAAEATAHGLVDAQSATSALLSMLSTVIGDEHRGSASVRAHWLSVREYVDDELRASTQPQERPH
jgi:hypothetical protein